MRKMLISLTLLLVFLTYSSLFTQDDIGKRGSGKNGVIAGQESPVANLIADN